MFETASVRELRQIRARLGDEIDAIERGECLCVQRAYMKLLERYWRVDAEIQHRERVIGSVMAKVITSRAAPAEERLPGISIRQGVGRRDK